MDRQRNNISHASRIPSAAVHPHTAEPINLSGRGNVETVGLRQRGGEKRGKDGWEDTDLENE